MNQQGLLQKKRLLINKGKFPTITGNHNSALTADFCNIVTQVDQLIEKVFPEIVSYFSNCHWLWERATLAPCNDDVNNINCRIQDSFPGMTTMYKSIDSVPDQDQTVYCPTEF